MDIDTSGDKPEWVYLAEQQIKLLCDKVRYEYKVLIMFLFDSEEGQELLEEMGEE